MADWMVWLAVAGVLIVLELATGTFYLLMMAIGLAFGALAAWMGATMPVQTITAAVHPPQPDPAIGCHYGGKRVIS